MKHRSVQQSGSEFSDPCFIGVSSVAPLGSTPLFALLGQREDEQRVAAACVPEPGGSVASTPATMGERVATSHWIWPVDTSMAFRAPEAWLSIRVRELPQ